MTVQKAFRNFYIFLLVFTIVLGAGTAGLAAYELCYKEEAVYAVSKYGSSGDEVRRIQQKLSDLGYYKDRVDGIYGINTQNAVKSFQRNVGLTADGIVGSATLLYLGLSGGSTTNNTSYSDADVQLLGKVISAEARGESYEGQVAVGAVILNRVAHSSFPDSISGVVYQNGDAGKFDRIDLHSSDTCFLQYVQFAFQLVSLHFISVPPPTNKRTVNGLRITKQFI